MATKPRPVAGCKLFFEVFDHNTNRMSFPPKHFAIVEPSIFRSSTFTKEHFPFVRQLKLHTIVYLSPEEAPRPLQDFCKEEEHQLTLMSLGNQAPLLTGRSGTSWTPLPGEVVKIALETVLDVSRHPLIIVCLSGVHQTGALVGCLRRLQGWSFTSIIEEYRRFSHGIGRSPTELYIEHFDPDEITVPPSTPSWFIREQELLMQEEEAARARS